MIPKNKKLLNSFVHYCNTHPEESFWQALVNWAVIPYLFAVAPGKDGLPDLRPESCEDVRYWKDKNELHGK